MDTAIASPLEIDVLKARLISLWEQTGDDALRRLAAGEAPYPGTAIDSEQEYSDWVSTALMNCYRNTGESAVFALLFEQNRHWFLQAITGKLRRCGYHVDPQDVLQEVFLNIYRYPHRFHPDRSDSFRGWGHRIARNTLLKFLKGQSRLSQFRELDEAVIQPEDMRLRRPDRVAIEAESAAVVNHAYVLYLQLYLVHFTKLSAKERRALTMVEVDGASYRDAAADLGIRLENLKMVIFRGRRKIFRGMAQSLVHLQPETLQPPIAQRAASAPSRMASGRMASGSMRSARMTSSRAASARTAAMGEVTRQIVGDALRRELRPHPDDCRAHGVRALGCRKKVSGHLPDLSAGDLGSSEH